MSTVDAESALFRRTLGLPTPEQTYPPGACKHHRCTPAFDEAAARDLSDAEVRRRWPRWDGPCPDCGQLLIAYASAAHYILGDW